MPQPGTVRVPIVADHSDFDRGIDRAERRLAAFGRSASEATARIAKYGAAVAAAAGAIGVAFVGRSLDAIDAQAKLARQLGTTTASMAVVERALALSGRSYGEVAEAITNMNRRLGEAERGTGAAVAALDMLGLEAGALIAMPLDERLRTIAVAMEKAKLSAAQQAVVMAQLGSEQGRLFNLLENGGAVLERATREAHAFGLAVSDIDASKIEAANDAMSTVGAVATGVANRMAVAVAPVIHQVATQFAEAAIKADGWGRQAQAASETAIRAVGKVVAVGGRLVAALEQNPYIGSFGMVGLMIFGKKGLVAGALLAEIGARTGRAFGLLEETASQAFDRIERRIGQRQSRLTEPLGRTTRARIEAEIDRLRESQQALLDAAGVSADNALEPFDVLLRKLQTTTGEAGELGRTIEDIGKKWADFQFTGGGLPPPNAPPPPASGLPPGFAAGLAKDQEEREEERRMKEQERMAEDAERFYLALLTEEEAEIESYDRRLAQLETFRDHEILLEEEYEAQRERLEQQHQDKLNDIRRKGETAAQKFLRKSAADKTATVLGEMAQMTAGVAQQNRALFNINKAAALGETIIQGFLGAERTWAAYPFPWNVPMVAAHIAGTVGRIAAISSQSFGGGGAAPSVAGTTPATPVTPVPQTTAAAGGGGAAQQVSISLNGDTFGRQQVIGLIEQINEAVSDGARLRVA